MNLFNDAEIPDLKFAAHEIFLLLEATRQLDGGLDFSGPANMAKAIDEALGNLSEHGLASDLDLVKRIASMVDNLGQVLSSKKDNAHNPLVAGLLEMATYRVTEFENDWEILILEDAAPQLS